MVVTVHLHTVLQRQTPEGIMRRIELSIPSMSTVSDLLALLNIDFPVESMLILVNGRLVEPEHVLEKGDKINLMPAIEGG